MIYYLATEDHRYTIDEYLAQVGAPLRASVQSVTYDWLLEQNALPAAVYIFSDIERVPPRKAEQIAVVWQTLSDAGLPLLNHPTRSMRRYELLRHLHAAGRNVFNTIRATEARLPARYPVFLRHEHDHDGAISGLLPDPAALEQALADLDRLGRSRDDVLIVEFCDTSDARGLYRKYSAFVCGDHVIPRHIFFGRHWMLKKPGAESSYKASLEEERQYIENNPHAEEIRSICRTARITFGRIDYALYMGRIQVWEINTNPYVLTSEGPTKNARQFLSEMFYSRFNEALRRTDQTMAPALVRISERASESVARKIIRLALRSLGLTAYVDPLLKRFAMIKRALVP